MTNAGIRRRGKLRIACFVSSLVCIGLAATPSEAAAPIGETVRAVGVVKNSTNLERRGLKIPDPVYFLELIETGKNSFAGFVFNDESRLSIGPEATLLLDDVVYDPDPSKSKMIMTMTVGVFSFVTGKLASEAYRIRTPSMSIAVRGTAFSVVVAPNGSTTVVLSRGSLSVSNLAGQTQVVSRPGQAISVRAPVPGLPPPSPTPPGPPSASVLAQVQALSTLASPAAPPAAVPGSIGTMVAGYGTIASTNAAPILMELYAAMSLPRQEDSPQQLVTLAGVIIALLSIAGFTIWVAYPRPAPATTDTVSTRAPKAPLSRSLPAKPLIADLPVVATSGTPEQESLADGITRQRAANVAGATVESAKTSEAVEHYEGVGMVVSVDLEARRIVLDHEAVEGFMAAMEMSYQVSPATPIQDLRPGHKVRFTINADERSIVGIEPIGV